MSERDLLAPFRGALLHDVLTRQAALPALGEDVLLHAGPPYASGDAVPPAVRNAAALALVQEGREPGLAAALAAMGRGCYRWQPAQDLGVVTPLAQVVTAGMPLLVVGDARTCRYAPIAEAPAPALRFGSTHALCMDNLRRESVWALAELAPRLRAAPVDMADVIAVALAGGDECHARTGAAHAALLERLLAREPRSGDASVSFPPRPMDVDAPVLSTAYRQSLAGNPGFVLTAIMAAAAWALGRSAGSLQAIGGNGREFGLRVRGVDHWVCTPATPPVGTRLPIGMDEPVLGAIGDSAVIDACGLGGQALSHAPALREEWQAVLPADWADRPTRSLGPDGILDPVRVAASESSPLIHLAMVGAGAEGGLLGRGFYLPRIEVFAHQAREISA